MVGFYVNVKLKAGYEAKFEEILKEIVPASRKDKGCISYECGVVAGSKNEYCFMESWENLESQKEHMKSAHMVKNAAALEACKESQEVKIINFVSVKE
jgi:antibiotic biosynthesis monooxygenase